MTSVNSNRHWSLLSYYIMDIDYVRIKKSVLNTGNFNPSWSLLLYCIMDIVCLGWFNIWNCAKWHIQSAGHVISHINSWFLCLCGKSVMNTVNSNPYCFHCCTVFDSWLCELMQHPELGTVTLTECLCGNFPYKLWTPHCSFGEICNENSWFQPPTVFYYFTVYDSW